MNVSRIYRLLRLVTLLQSGRSYTAAQLADDLQVSRRTIFRDLNALELAHIPYYYDPADKGFRISRHFFLQPVNLTLGEALALLLLSGRLQNDSCVPLLDQGAQAAAKIESILPHSIRDHLGSVLARLSVKLGPLAKHEGADAHFDRLADAVARRRVCRMQYESFHEGKRIRLTVHPLKLVFLRRAWYLLAYDRRHREVRTFKLIRIVSLEVTGKRFSDAHAAELEDHFGLAWSMIPEGKVYKVHLRFSPRMSRNVAEVQWHATQQTEFRDDGSLDFRAEVDGLGEIAWWILGYGDEVEVLAPKALRGKVSRKIRNMAAIYAEES
jgi:proteasome accessory factor B